MAAASKAGLQLCAEGFIDRRYAKNGELVPRDQISAVIQDVRTAVSQAMQIACKGRVETPDGTCFPLSAQTLCVHGDSLHAVETLRAVRQVLIAAGIQLEAPSIS